MKSANLVSRKVNHKSSIPKRFFSDKINSYYQQGHRNLKFEHLSSFSYVDTKALEDISDIHYKPNPITIVDKSVLQITEWMSKVAIWVCSNISTPYWSNLVHEMFLAPNRNVTGVLRRFPAFQSSANHADLIEYEENEKMHQYIWLELIKPNIIVSLLLLWWNYAAMKSQFLFTLIAPRTAKKYFGYLQYQTIKHYSQQLNDLSENDQTSIPEVAREYWNLSPEATLRDLLLVLRADKIHHSMTGLNKE